MIEVKNLTKRYGDHAAVDNISFTVEKGRIYGFLGPNGAGKSTTMNMLTGYLAPSSGQITVNGHDILEEPEEAKASIGYLPEIPPLYTDMTVEEYLSFAAELKKVAKSEREKQLEEVMTQTDILNMRGRLIRNLSKGYKQRVGLAQALLGSPEVLILDEPMVGLDPKQIVEIRDLIRELGKKHTVILSSHILSEIRMISDTLIIISHGRLVAIDSPDKLEKKMGGSGLLKLLIRGSREEAEETISSLAGIMSFDIKPSETEIGAVEVELTPEEDVDLRESVFYAMAGANLPILGMAAEKISLEDVFLELTEGEKESAPEEWEDEEESEYEEDVDEEEE